MESLSDHDIPSLAAALMGEGHKPSNARRVLREYWDANGSLDVQALDISKSARRFLQDQLIPRHSQVLRRHVSADGTIKLLIGYEGKRMKDEVRRLNPTASDSSFLLPPSSISTECVLMPSHRPDRAAACISSQIGCAMGCDFCASTKAGLERNLGVGEIVEQFMHLRTEARAQGRRIASLVFMGMGEPMHNLDHVIPAIRLLAAPGLGDMGFRAITVSTVGVVPGIDRLAEADLGVHLALSLHAPDDATRDRLVPSNRRWPVAEIMTAARRFQAKARRPSNIEYCMLAGVNDSDEQAHMLADLMEGFRAHVNLIPYNTIGAGVSGVIYLRPSEQRIARFLNILRDHGVVAHVRVTRGDDISAACGQLRLA